jgi:hypothetical protein
LNAYLCLGDVLSCHAGIVALLPLSHEHIVEETKPIEQEAHAQSVGLQPGSRQIRWRVTVAVHVHSIAVHGAARFAARTVLDVIVDVKFELVALVHFSGEVPVLELKDVLINVCVELNSHAVLRGTARWCSGTAVVHHHHAAAHGTAGLRIRAGHHCYGGASRKVTIELILALMRCDQEVDALHVSISFKRALIVER